MSARSSASASPLTPAARSHTSTSWARRFSWPCASACRRSTATASPRRRSSATWRRAAARSTGAPRRARRLKTERVIPDAAQPRSGTFQREGSNCTSPGFSLREPRDDEVSKMHSPFAMMAAYNAWANRRLYDAAAALPDADYRGDRGAFFKSVHGTLNHLLVADRIWMRRFTGEGDAPTRLDAILFEQRDELRAARRAEDERILRYVEGLTDAALAGRIRYRNISNSAEFEQPLAPALLHLFNHQTHHRGQVHGLLTALTGEAPSLDLILFQRESGMGLT